MDESLIPVRKFLHVAEAEVCRELLKGEGIQSFVFEAGFPGADWLLGPAVGEVKLMVPAEVAARATELLKCIPPNRAPFETNEYDGTEPELNLCLSCGAKMAENSDRCEQCGWSFDDGAEPA